MGAETRVLTGCSGSAHSSPRLQTQGRLHEDESTGCPSPWVLLEQDHTHTHVQTLPGETGLLTGLPSEMRLQTAPCGVQGSSALEDRTGPHTPDAQTAHPLGRRDPRSLACTDTPPPPPGRQASQAATLLPTSHPQMGRWWKPGSAPAPDVTSSETSSPIRVSSLGACAQGS